MKRRRPAERALTIAVLLAVAADVLISTALGLARGDLIGDLGADVDQYAGLSGIFTAARIFSFAAIPWVVGWLGARSAFLIGTSISAILASVLTLADELIAHAILHALTGFAGGGVIVAGQTLLLCALPRRAQPKVQAFFAIAVAAGPAALSPAASGWLLDVLDWRAIYGLAAALGLLSLLAQSVTRLGDGLATRRAPLDAATLLLLAVASGSTVHALSRGQRWSWFDTAHIVWAAGLAILTMALCLLRLLRQTEDRRTISLALFTSADFGFGLCASLASGVALFGSSWLIQGFATRALGFDALELGGLLLPSAAAMALSLALVAFVVRRTPLPPALVIPLGVALFMTAAVLLSYQSRASGLTELLPAVLLRGLALGLLFIAITLTFLVGLPQTLTPQAVGLFNLTRQIGGLAGVAWLSTQVEHRIARSRDVLGASIVPGDPVLDYRLAALSSIHVGKGDTAAEAQVAALFDLGRSLAQQSQAIAFNHAFASIALFFIAAAPVLLLLRKLISNALAVRFRRAKPCRGHAITASESARSHVA